ncbi:uncharacterized protein EHS24_000691 [Apiotrichum porosum]|uniref:PHD-type domain-containing protein n=1 Tax=Apiotrichum porosum TaxID=105984 RepID=A0A427YAM2_9TREE|nr:uncharacterized protein EHS24_000691 [Apiotrichum porosum]RSH88163.1 hypothetical protein EHS24_000691 [Apiotrichum porosum]
MPRKVLPPTVVAPGPAPPPSPLVQKLRQDWRWAGISQFIWTFADAFGLVEWDIETLERDLDGTEDAIIPDLVAKMLYALTWNRQINRENAFDQLRKQYVKRAPEGEVTILGTVEEPIEWPTLGLSQKVQILWQLCEWQMVDPARFRSLLKTEEEATSWRVDPLGWDKHGNTYFLFDDNRLWIQRARPVAPRPPKKSSLKAKRAERALKRQRPPPKRSHKRKAPPKRLPTPPPPKPEEPVSGPRRRKQVEFYGNVTPTVEALKRGGGTRTADATPTSNRSTRSSARTRGAVETPTKPSRPSRAPPLPTGTRVSRRLHAVDDEWQQVPDDWLNGDKKTKKAKPTKGKANDDGDSDLSDLTDEDEHEATLKALDDEEASPEVKPESPLSEAPEEPQEPEDEYVPSEHAGDDEAVKSEDEAPIEEDVEQQEEEEDEDEEDDREPSADIDELQLAVKEEATELPEGFVEWETVCVSLYDWQHYPDQWEKSKHPDEKALYKLLKDEVGPQIIEVLQAKEQERLKQEALNNRKRSSRIATRELEREEAIRREAAEREMEERMEKSRQEEAKKAADAAEHAAREKAREDRLKEREERSAARQQAALAKAEAEQKEREKAERKRERRKRRRDGEQVSDSSADEAEAPAPVDPTPAKPEGSATPKDSWELKCEVCKQSGWNLVDDTGLVSCDDCGRWQHVECHDRQDIAAGRGIRDWDKVDFRCKECEQRAAAKRRRVEEPHPAAHQNRPPHVANGHPGYAAAVPPRSQVASQTSPYQYAHPVPQMSPQSSGYHQLPPQGPPHPGQAYHPHPYPQQHHQQQSPPMNGHVVPRHPGYPPDPRMMPAQPGAYAQHPHHPGHPQQYPPHPQHAYPVPPPHYANGQTHVSHPGYGHPQSPQSRQQPLHHAPPHQHHAPPHPQHSPRVDPRAELPRVDGHRQHSEPRSQHAPQPYPPQPYPPQPYPPAHYSPAPHPQHPQYYARRTSGESGAPAGPHGPQFPQHRAPGSPGMSQAERIEREQPEREHVERERMERERIDRERMERERAERERVDRERMERDRIERERLGPAQPVPRVAEGQHPDAPRPQA